MSTIYFFRAPRRPLHIGVIVAPVSSAMPVRKAVELNVDVPSRRAHFGGGLDNPEDDAGGQQPKSGGKAPKSTASARKRSARKASSPYYRKDPGPGPATLMNGMTIASPPISSRTRNRTKQKRDFPLPLPPVAAPSVQRPRSDGAPGPSSSSSSWAAETSKSAPVEADTGPLARQKVKEDKWREKLNKQASWWDSAAAAVSQSAVAADVHMGEASRAYRTSDSSLRTLLRARNHAQADKKQVDTWKDEAIDRFVGGRDPSKKSKEPEPPPHLVPSPNHFERAYGVPRKPLPALRMETRTRIAQGARVAKDREDAAMEARSKAFGKQKA